MNFFFAFLYPFFRVVKVYAPRSTLISLSSIFHIPTNKGGELAEELGFKIYRNSLLHACP